MLFFFQLVTGFLSSTSLNRWVNTRSNPTNMCGILAVYDSSLSPEALRLKTLTLQRLVRHRGPDGSGIHATSSFKKSIIAHERLSIVDPLSGNQPLFSD